MQRWYENQLTLRAGTFPIYAVAGWPAQINGSGSRDGRLTDLTVAHFAREDADLSEDVPSIQITTSTEPLHGGALRIARLELERLVADEVEHQGNADLSDAAVTLWFKAHRRLRRGAALGAIRSDGQITIDGAPRTFLALTTASGRWVAVRRHENLTITVAARNVATDSITIEAIIDPDTRLLGPEPSDS